MVSVAILFEAMGAIVLVMCCLGIWLCAVWGSADAGGIGRCCGAAVWGCERYETGKVQSFAGMRARRSRVGLQPQHTVY